MEHGSALLQTDEIPFHGRVLSTHDSISKKTDRHYTPIERRRINIKYDESKLTYFCRPARIEYVHRSDDSSDIAPYPTRRILSQIRRGGKWICPQISDPRTTRLVSVQKILAGLKFRDSQRDEGNRSGRTNTRTCLRSAERTSMEVKEEGGGPAVATTPRQPALGAALRDVRCTACTK